MFSCPRCNARFEADTVPYSLTCPRCRDEDRIFSPLTFWLFDSPVLRPERTGTTQRAVEKPPPRR